MWIAEVCDLEMTALASQLQPFIPIFQNVLNCTTMGIFDVMGGGGGLDIRGGDYVFR